MSSLNSIRDTFFEECEDLLEALTEGLANMADGSADDETVNAVFRAVHSIKGGAGAFGLEQLVSFAHSFETVLDKIRNNTLEPSPEVLRVLQRSGDILVDIVDAARGDEELDSPAVGSTLDELGEILGEAPKSASPEPEAEFSFQPMTIDVETEDDPLAAFSPTPVDVPNGETVGFEVSFKPHWGLYANGHDPSLLIVALSQLGDIEVELDDRDLPEFENLAEEAAHLSWSIRLTTQESETVLHEVFEFVEGLCDLTINPILGESPLPTDLAADVEDEVHDQPETAETVPSETKLVQPEPTTPLKEKEKSDPKKSSGPRPTLRVDLDRVDRLINTVGELIINQAMISQRISGEGLDGSGELSNDLEDYKLLAREIQEAVMAIRAQPVKPLFQRMSRIVRESADATQKQAKLEVIGEATEVDKTVIERLADPLTHMIRNAVDHGLESTETRISNGKPETGTITLTAAHRSGNVIIEVADDGGGLNREKVLDIALRKELVKPDVELSESEIDNLLFMPGFSTVEKVSNLSGRGVGMDVVKNSVNALGGRVSINSTPGQGTKFTIVLPLTLAVMDGMVVSVAGQTMVVPLSAMLETIRPNSDDLYELGTDRQLLSVRGRYIPVVDIADKLGLLRQQADETSQIYLLVETENSDQCALGVDQIYDQRQVVIKSLDSNYRSIPGVSAATILGDGQIALILDTDAVATMQNVAGAANRLPEPVMEM
ncbi:MAG: chemotaxis protein CheA [Pseudomonadota bacterium]